MPNALKELDKSIGVESGVGALSPKVAVLADRADVGAITVEYSRRLRKLTMPYGTI
jgi:hypothetical protein